MACPTTAAPGLTEFVCRAGEYRVGLTRAARVQELSGEEQTPYLLLTLYVEGDSQEALAHITELAQGLVAWVPASPGGRGRSRPQGAPAGQARGAEQGEELPLKQVREVPAAEGESRRWMEVVLAAPRREVTELRKLAGAVVRFSDKQAVAAEFTQLGSAPQQVRREGVWVSLEAARWEAPARGQPRFQVELRAQFPVPSPTSGRSAWLGDQVELVDRQGTAWSPEARSWSCERDAQGQIQEVRMQAYFSRLALRRGVGAIRYRAEWLTGIRSLPYSFEHIPLP